MDCCDILGPPVKRYSIALRDKRGIPTGEYMVVSQQTYDQIKQLADRRPVNQ